MSNPEGFFDEDNDLEHSLENELEATAFISDQIPEDSYRAIGSSGAGGGFNGGSLCISEKLKAVIDRYPSLNLEEDGTVVSNPDSMSIVSNKFNPVSQDALAISDDSNELDPLAISVSYVFKRLDSDGQLISGNAKYDRKEFSELATDMVGEVLTRLEPLTICRPLGCSDLRWWMMTRNLLNVKKVDGFLVSGILDGVGVTQNVDFYLDKEFNLVHTMEHQGRVSMLGTTNGLVLFMMDKILVVMNPITRTKRSLPSPFLDFDQDVHQLYDFHYMESKKEYYILRIVQHMEESYRTDVEMYSSSTDMWNVIQPPLPCLDRDMRISFKIKPVFTCPIYHVNYPVKIGNKFYYITVDPEHSYYAAIISFNMEDYAFEFVKIFPAEVHRMSYVVELGVSTDGILSLLMTNAETNMRQLTTFSSEGSTELWYPGTSLVPELIRERLEQMGAVFKKLFPFTDSLCSVSLRT